MLKNTKPKIHKIIFPIMCASLVKLSHFSVPVISHFRVVILMSFDITKRRSHVQSSFLFTTCLSSLFSFCPCDFLGHDV